MRSNPDTRAAPALVIRDALARPDEFASVLMFTSHDGGITVDVSLGAAPAQPCACGQVFAADIAADIAGDPAHLRIHPA